MIDDSTPKGAALGRLKSLRSTIDAMATEYSDNVSLETIAEAVKLLIDLEMARNGERL